MAVESARPTIEYMIMMSTMISEIQTMAMSIKDQCLVVNNILTLDAVGQDVHVHQQVFVLFLVLP